MPLQRDPAKWANTTCAVCGKSFDHRADRPRQFCSMVCTGVGRVKTPRPSDPKFKAETACPTCGETFSYWLSWPRKFCSKRCAGKATVKNLGGVTGTRYLATCEVCSEQFSTVPSQPARFCGQKCFGRWQSANVRGPNHPRTGLRYELPKQRVTLTCQTCGGSYQVKPSQVEKSRCCSRACLGKWHSETHRGESSPTWRGGYDPYYGPSWRSAMRATRQRDSACQRCGKTPEQAGKALDVHHLTPFRDYGVKRHAEANRLENLTALCNPCHLLVEWETNRRSG